MKQQYGFDPAKIGKRIREYRTAQGLTVTNLASAIGRTESTVRKYESGSVEVPLSTLSRICETLEVSIFDLLGGRHRECKNETPVHRH